MLKKLAAASENTAKLVTALTVLGAAAVTAAKYLAGNTSAALFGITLIGLLVLALVVKLLTNLKEIRDQFYNNGGSTLRDVIDRSFSEVTRTLRLIEMNFGVLWEHWDVPSYKCDADGMCISANNALCDLYGMSREEMLGTGWTAAIKDSDQRANAWRHWQESRRDGLPYVDSYTIINQKTGEVNHAETWAKVARNPKTGKPEGYIGLLRVVGNTEKKRETDWAK